ncbi:hypothetical protein GEMRC1_004173 [Eukaryota sp. GEM-RC1]
MALDPTLTLDPINDASPLLDKPVKAGTQSGITAVFSIVSTMLGSSVLALPWALSQAGFIYSWVIAIIIGLICYYTCLLISKHTKNYKDFADLLYDLYGSWARILAHFASALVVCLSCPSNVMSLVPPSPTASFLVMMLLQCSMLS